MTTSTRRARRRSGGGAGSHTLARLAAAREQLDADIVAQRRREDELLAEYAAVADAAAAVAARRDAALADLDRQAAQVRAAADRELSVLEGQQGAVLVAMHARRSADSLAKLVGLPVKQVRGLLRTHRAPAQASPAGDGGTRPGVAPGSIPASAPVLAHPPAPGPPVHRPGDEDRERRGRGRRQGRGGRARRAGRGAPRGAVRHRGGAGDGERPAGSVGLIRRRPDRTADGGSLGRARRRRIVAGVAERRRPDHRVVTGLVDSGCGIRPAAGPGGGRRRSVGGQQIRPPAAGRGRPPPG